MSVRYDNEARAQVMRMTTIGSERNNRRSSLTVLDATGKSRVSLTEPQTAIPDPSAYRVGSFHAPAGRASAVPTLGLPNGTA